jgi:type II secretory pathway component GspD/PulD (secretin)/Tol biopolymer transport system component
MTKNKSPRYIYSILFSVLMGITCTTSAKVEFIADGVMLTPLTDDGQSKAIAWAWHGDLVSFIRDIPGSSQNQLFIMKKDGSGKQPITPIGSTFFAEWSWSGTKLSYLFSNANNDQSQSGAYIYDLLTARSFPISAPYIRNALDEDEGPIWSADDRYLAYKARPGISRLREVWVHDAQDNKTIRILTEFTEVQEARWSCRTPDRICLRTKAPGGWDIGIVNPDGNGLVQLTNVGAESVEAGKPIWSPTEDRIAFIYNKDMTQQERGNECSDCWIISSDGSGARNLTTATSQSTEKQLKLDELFWSWDGRWILAIGERFDIQGNEIETLYLIDPKNGGYRILLSSYPREKSEIEDFDAFTWSFDSSRIALLTERRIVRNWGEQAAYEQSRTVLSIYDIRTDTRTDLLILNKEQDRKVLMGRTERKPIENISWSPDNRSLLVTIGNIISASDNIIQSDIYRMDLPDSLISPEAANHNGPVMGRNAMPAAGTSVTKKTIASKAADPNRPGISENQATEIQPQAIAQTPAKENLVTVRRNGTVIETIQPMHISIEDTLASLPGRYKQLLTGNTTLNLLVYEGPVDTLADLQEHLSIIDKKSPQILVDLLAVELSEEANRELGLDWTYAQGRVGLFQPMGNSIRDLTPDARLDGIATYPGTGQAFYQGVGSLPREFFVRLNSLVADGKGSILANPRTVATSGHEAIIQIRKTLNYFFNEGFDDAGRPIVKKSDISADTQGRITPTLLADSSIRMNVDIKVGSFTFSAAEGLPEQTNRESTTIVTVREGQTLVIGGLRQQEMNQVVAKVPILGDLPLIGVLFKKSKKDIKNSVLTLFVTPHLLPENNTVPDWPQIKRDEQMIIPIMPEAPDIVEDPPADKNNAPANKP